MKKSNNTFWLIVGFLGGLFAVIENGHELYENYKGRMDDDGEEDHKVMGFKCAEVEDES